MRRRSPYTTYHVLLQKGRGKTAMIRAMSKSDKGVVRQALPIIRRAPKRTLFRYGKLVMDNYKPQFHPGE